MLIFSLTDGKRAPILYVSLLIKMGDGCYRGARPFCHEIDSSLMHVHQQSRCHKRKDCRGAVNCLRPCHAFLISSRHVYGFVVLVRWRLEQKIKLFFLRFGKKVFSVGEIILMEILDLVCVFYILVVFFELCGWTGHIFSPSWYQWTQIICWKQGFSKGICYINYHQFNAF
jgi:hypothetical protein